MHIKILSERLYVEAYISILFTTLGFIFYHFSTTSKKSKPILGIGLNGKGPGVKSILFQRITGVLFYGIIPLFTVVLIFQEKLHYYGINHNMFDYSIKWIIILAPFLIVMNYVNSKKEDNLSMYPQIRVKHWNISLLLLSAFSWIAYLCAYEFLFRGFLLFSCYHAFGTTVAVLINTFIYALVHLPKSWKETIGAVPLGIVLCLFTLKTGNIIIALLVHIVLALSNEWFSLRAHPDMKLVIHNKTIE